MGPSKRSRRQMLASAGSVARSQAEREEKPAAKGDPVPLEELVNSLEFEAQARRVLPGDLFSTIAGSDRSAFDRYTFRPRMNVSTLEMDLSVTLFGDELFTPIVVGPISDQRRYHPEGELATLAGASKAKTVTIVSSHASLPLAQMGRRAAQSTIPFWYAVYAEPDAPASARAAVAAGAKAVFVTVGASYEVTGGGTLPARPQPIIDWGLVETIRGAVEVPVALKGVMSSSDARRAVALGLDGIVVSNFGGLLDGGGSAPIDALAAVADAVGDRLPILVDGSFRRATDILDALILGATGVLLGRPIVWALAAYGAEGVTSLLEMLQRDLARCFAMLGAPNLASLTRLHLKKHRR